LNSRYLLGGGGTDSCDVSVGIQKNRTFVMYGLKDNKSNLIIKISKGQSEAVYKKNDRQYNGQKKKDKKTNNDLQTTIHKATLQRRYLISAHDTFL
jgi:hypothetical protein